MIDESTVDDELGFVIDTSPGVLTGACPAVCTPPAAVDEALILDVTSVDATFLDAGVTDGLLAGDGDSFIAAAGFDPTDGVATG